MTPAEWMEMSQAAAANASAIYAILLTVIGAYLVVAYTAGKELSRSQVTLVNAFYLFSAFVAIVLLLGATRNYFFAFNQAAMGIVELQSYPRAIVVGGMALIGLGNTALVIASMKFLWDIRHPMTE